MPENCEIALLRPIPSAAAEVPRRAATRLGQRQAYAAVHDPEITHTAA